MAARLFWPWRPQFQNAAPPDRLSSKQRVAERVGFVPIIAVYCVILTQSSVLHRANTAMTLALQRASTFTDSFTDSERKTGNNVRQLFRMKCRITGEGIHEARLWRLRRFDASSPLKYHTERRVRARGLQDFLGIHGSCRPGALTGRIFQLAARRPLHAGQFRR
jgi:hypothetical protein